MRYNAVATCVIFLVVGTSFLAVGGDLAGWWTVPAGLSFDTCSATTAAECASSEGLGEGFAGLGAAFIGLVAMLNVWWAFRRARARRLRAVGVRVPAVVLSERRVGGNNGSGSSSSHHKQRWQALLPDGRTTEFTTRSGWSIGEGRWLEAAADGEDVVLMIDVGRQAAFRGTTLAESEQAAGALLRHREAAAGPEPARHALTSPGGPS